MMSGKDKLSDADEAFLDSLEDLDLDDSNEGEVKTYVVSDEDLPEEFKQALEVQAEAKEGPQGKEPEEPKKKRGRPKKNKDEEFSVEVVGVTAPKNAQSADKADDEFVFVMPESLGDPRNVSPRTLAELEMGQRKLWEKRRGRVARR